jgi:hypothetical protein
MAIKIYSKEELKDIEDKTDYERLKKMTEADVESGSVSDEDAVTPSAKDFETFRKVGKDD